MHKSLYKLGHIHNVVKPILDYLSNNVKENWRKFSYEVVGFYVIVEYGNNQTMVLTKYPGI